MNRNSLRIERKLARALRPRTQWWAVPLAFLATLLALPVNAGVTIPGDPLATGTLRVKPNVLFVLDDSGSMSFENMPDNVPNTSTPDVSDFAYTRNTLSYNPATTYGAWYTADGTRMTGGTSYDAVYASFNLVGGTTIDLSNPSSCARFNSNSNSTTDELSSGGTQKCGGVQTFYVPKDTASSSSSYLGNGTNYYRYQILTDGRVIRSEYLGYTAANTPRTDKSSSGTITTNASAAKNGYSTGYTMATPANTTTLTFTASHASAKNYNLYARTGSAYTGSGGTPTCNDTNTTSANKTCTVSSPASSTTYYLTIKETNTAAINSVTLKYSYGYYDYSDVLAMGCAGTTSGSDWRNCTDVSSAGDSNVRAAAAEMTNYATWYSYYRTRNKMAKAGASEAFNSLGADYRVGFRTIWGRDVTNANANWPTQAKPIPLGNGTVGTPMYQGLFTNDSNGDGNVSTSEKTTSNRALWYQRMQSAIAYSGTPLHDALNEAGKYYQGSSSTGAYGPESGSAQLTCRQHFTILATDGYWNNLAGSYSDANSVTLGNEDGISSLPNYTAGAPYADTYSVTLADVAMHYWKTDLRTDMNNEVPAGGADPAIWQHMVTFGIAIGLAGTSGVKSVDEVDSSYSYVEVPALSQVPSSGTLARSSTTTSSISGVVAGLSMVITSGGTNIRMSQVTAPGGAVVCTNTTSCTVSSTVAGTYTVTVQNQSATANRGWTLTVAATSNSTNYWPNPMDSEDTDRIDDLLHAAVNGHGAYVSAANPSSFAEGLKTALAQVAQRTGSFSNAGASDSTQLNAGSLIFSASYMSGRWTGLLQAKRAVDSAQQWSTDSSGVFAAYGSRKVYTRNGTMNTTTHVGGDGTGGGMAFPTSLQQTQLDRSTVGPVDYPVSGTDNANYIKGDQGNEGTATGKLRVRSNLLGDIVNSSPAYVVGGTDGDGTSAGTVYVGANDGMLHAFNASNGHEVFAYIPNILNFGSLSTLSRGDYEHKWFVDGPIVISPHSLSATNNKNYLVGTLGRGGKGLYALNVSDPTASASNIVLWERAETPNNNMGQVLGAPLLVKVRGSSNPVVVFGNGINSTSGKAALVVLDLLNGNNTPIREIEVPDTTTGDNGLFAPTGIYAADGKTLIYVYAGDLKGNVWKFDLTSSTPSSWSAKKIFAAGNTQPITGGIASAVDPRTNTRWVFFGTGRYLSTDDANDLSTSAQSMYGVMDDISTGSAYARTDLQARTVTSADTDGNQRYFQDLATLAATKKGWYVDLPGVGERIVQNAQIDGSYLVTASMMPSGNTCADVSGSGYINALTPFPGMTASGTSYFDLNHDGTPDTAGTSGYATGSVKTSGMPTLPLLFPGQLYYQASSGSGQTLFKGTMRWNRVSWRELRNE